MGQRDTTTAASTYEDDDPSKEKEAELILDYIDMFNALFDDEKYEAAAIHAANSPRGILRTMDTLNKFKGQCQSIFYYKGKLVFWGGRLLSFLAVHELVITFSLARSTVNIKVSSPR
jgi:hypothetical protein